MPSPASTDIGFERTFADLAYARLRDKAPTLLDYLLGFQLIDKNDEETHAVGVFAFKVGEDWIYAPVFFINGELKGHELLYLKNQDAFIPMTEGWVNYVLNRRPASIGKVERTPRNLLGIKQPDFDLFARVPYIGSKYAAARSTFKEVVAKMAEPYRPFMEAFVVSPVSDVKFASLRKRFTVPGALQVLGKQAVLTLFKSMKTDETFADAILSQYDVAALDKAVKNAADKLTKVEAEYKDASASSKCSTCEHYKSSKCELVEGSISPDGTCKYYEYCSEMDKNPPIGPLDSSQPLTTKGASDSFVVPMDRAPYRERPEGKVVVVLRGDDISNVAADLTDADREKLMRDQYVVKDERNPDRRGRVYRTQLSATITSPDASGVYDVILPGGDKRKLTVLVKPMRIGYCPDGHAISATVIDKERGRYGNFDLSEVLVQGRHGGLDSLSDLISPSELKPDDIAVLIGSDGAVTSPFSVENSYTSPDGFTELRIWANNDPSPSSMLTKQRDTTRPQAANIDDGTVRSLVLTERDGTGLKRLGESLFVPKNTKAYLVFRPPSRRRGTGNGLAVAPYSRSASSDLAIGSLTDLALAVKKAADTAGVAQVRMLTNGLSFQLAIGAQQSHPMSKLAMLKHLIVGLGLDQPDAELMLKEAEPRRPRTYYVKRADYSSAPQSAWFPEPVVGQEYGITVPTQYPLTLAQNLGTNDTLANREVYRDDRTIDPQSRRIAEGAAASGQKELLDTAVITGLVKTMDTDAKVDGYISDLLLGLDRVGRILFMYYWHNDKFKDRYGQQDMLELEDNLRNVFKNLGELSLFLKQKTIEPDADTTAEARLDEVLG